MLSCALSFFFFFNDTATTEIYTSFPTRRSSDLARRGARTGGDPAASRTHPARRLRSGLDRDARERPRTSHHAGQRAGPSGRRAGGPPHGHVPVRDAAVARGRGGLPRRHAALPGPDRARQLAKAFALQCAVTGGAGCTT